MYKAEFGTIYPTKQDPVQFRVLGDVGIDDLLANLEINKIVDRKDKQDTKVDVQNANAQISSFLNLGGVINNEGVLHMGLFDLKVSPEFLRELQEDLIRTFLIGRLKRAYPHTILALEQTTKIPIDPKKGLTFVAESVDRKVVYSPNTKPGGHFKLLDNEKELSVGQLERLLPKYLDRSVQTLEPPVYNSITLVRACLFDLWKANLGLGA